MLGLVALVIRWLASVGRSRRELLLENIALRQQLATMVQRKRPRIRSADRVLWIALRRVWSRWAEVLVIVKPETVVGCHRAGFRLCWQRFSRRGMRRGRPVVPGEVRDLIRRMAAENQWRAPFLVNMKTIDASLSRHPGWAAYKARTGMVLPRLRAPAQHAPEGALAR